MSLRSKKKVTNVLTSNIIPLTVKIMMTVYEL